MFEETIISFVGSGMMAEAMIAGLLNQNLVEPERVIAAGPRVERGEQLAARYGVRWTTDNEEAAEEGQILILSVKPQVLKSVIPQVRGHLLRQDLGLSIVAGAGLDSDGDFDNAIRLLAENSRLAALPAIAGRFAALKQEAEGKIEVRVRSAQELSAEQQDSIARSMAKRLGKEVSISAEIDDSLIAGAVITAGDLVIDGSASGRIEKLSLAVNK